MRPAASTSREIDSAALVKILRGGWVAFLILLGFGAVVAYASFNRLEPPVYDRFIPIHIDGGGETPVRARPSAPSPECEAGLGLRDSEDTVPLFERQHHGAIIRPHYTGPLSASRMGMTRNGVLRFRVGVMLEEGFDPRIAGIVDDLNAQRDDLLADIEERIRDAEARLRVQRDTIAEHVGDDAGATALSAANLRSEQACTRFEIEILELRQAALSVPIEVPDLPAPRSANSNLHKLVAYIAATLVGALLAGFLVGYGRWISRHATPRKADGRPREAETYSGTAR